MCYIKYFKHSDISSCSSLHSFLNLTKRNNIRMHELQRGAVCVWKMPPHQLLRAQLPKSTLERMPQGDLPAALQKRKRDKDLRFVVSQSGPKRSPKNDRSVSDQPMALGEEVVVFRCFHFCHTACVKAQVLKSIPVTECPKCSKPLDDGSFFYAALVCFLSGDFERAEKYLRRQLELTSDHLETMNFLTLALFFQTYSTDSLDSNLVTHEAIEVVLDELLIREPDNYHLLLRMGLCRRGLRNFSGAVESFRKALSIQSCFPQPWVGILTCLFCLGKRSEALETTQIALEHVPQDPVLLRFLYMMYKVNAKPQLAKALGKKLRAAEPSDPFDMEFSQLLLLCFKDRTDEEEAERFPRWMKGVLALSGKLCQIILCIWLFEQTKCVVDDIWVYFTFPLSLIQLHLRIVGLSISSQRYFLFFIVSNLWTLVLTFHNPESFFLFP